MKKWKRGRFAPTSAVAADPGSWASSLGRQDFTALAVLAFLVIVVIPSLVRDMLETQADPAAAIAKKQEKLKALSDKYAFLAGDGPEAPAADAPRVVSARRAADEATAEDLIASVNALTGGGPRDERKDAKEAEIERLRSLLDREAE